MSGGYGNPGKPDNSTVSRVTQRRPLSMHYLRLCAPDRPMQQCPSGLRPAQLAVGFATRRACERPMRQM